MTSQTTSNIRYALFTSDLQPSDQASGRLAAVAAEAAIARFGVSGCVSRAAAEFGDHPETAAARMRWAGRLADEMLTGQPDDDRGTVTAAA